MNHKNLIRFLLFLLITGSIQQTVFATPAQQLTQRLKNIQTVQSHFTQTVFADNGKRAISTVQGKLLIKKPEKFLWQVQKPMQQTIATDGNILWNYQPLLKQVVISPLQQGIQATPLAILAGNEKAIVQNYQVDAAGKQAYWLKAKHTGHFQKIFLQFNAEKLSEMVLFDHAGQKTSIRFADNLRLNSKLPDTLFRLQWPKDTDVIDNSK